MGVVRVVRPTARMELKRPEGGAPTEVPAGKGAGARPVGTVDLAR